MFFVLRRPRFAVRALTLALATAALAITSGVVRAQSDAPSLSGLVPVCPPVANVSASASYGESTPEAAFLCSEPATGGAPADSELWNASDTFGSLQAQFADGPHTFGGVRVHSCVSSPSAQSLGVEVSDDGATWTVAAVQSVIVTGCAPLEETAITFPAYVTASWVRITGASEPAWLAFGYVRLLEQRP